MVKTSFERMANELEAFQAAMKAMDGDLGSVTYDPHDPQSIELALASIDRLVDERAAPFSSNSMATKAAQVVKDHFRQVLLEQAALKRLGDDQAQ